MAYPAVSTSLSGSTPVADPSSGNMSLQQYMQQAAALLVALISLSTQNTQVQTNMSNQLVSMNQALANKAADNAQNIQHLLDEEQNESGWQKLLGEIGGALLAALGALTGDPVLCMTGCMLFAMNVSGGQQALNDQISQWSSNPLVQGMINLGFALAMAVVTAGVSGGVEALASDAAASTTNSAAAGSADAAASATTDDTVASAADDLSQGIAAGAGASDDVSVTNILLDDTLKTSADGAAGAGNGTVAQLESELETVLGDIEEDLAGASSQGGASGGGQSASFTSKAWSGAKGSWWGAAGQSTLTFNPFIGISQAVANACGFSNDTAQLIGQIVGLILAVAAAGAGGYTSWSSGGGSFKAIMSQSGLATKAGLFLSLAEAGIQAGSAANGIQAGVNGLQLADLIGKKADIDSQQTILEIVQDMMSEIINQTQSSAQGTNQTFADMNQNWGNYLAQFKQGPYIK